MPKKDSEKARRKAEKKERKRLEALIKESKTKTDEAKVLLETIVKSTGTPNYPKAIEALTEAIERDPQNAEAFTLRGHARRDQMLLEEAVDDYSKAYALSPNSVAALEGRATCHVLLREFERAIQDCTVILSIHPENDHAHNLRGAARLKKRTPGLLLKNSDFEAVVEDFRESLRLNPNNFHARANLGKAYADQRLHREAIAEFTAALAINDSYRHALYRRACASMTLATEVARDQERVTEELARKKERLGVMGTSGASEVTFMTPSEQIALEDRATALVAERTKLLKGAVADFLALINPEARNHEITAVIHLGSCYFDLGDDEKAMAEYTFAMQHITQEAASGGAADTQSAALLMSTMTAGNTFSGTTLAATAAALLTTSLAPAPLGDVTVVSQMISSRLKQLEARKEAALLSSHRQLSLNNTTTSAGGVSSPPKAAVAAR